MFHTRVVCAAVFGCQTLIWVALFVSGRLLSRQGSGFALGREVVLQFFTICFFVCGRLVSVGVALYMEAGDIVFRSRMFS
jgi:hypothetical protein